MKIRRAPSVRSYDTAPVCDRLSLDDIDHCNYIVAMRYLLLILMMTATAATVSRAQSVGMLSGTVVDESGAPIGGAVITLHGGRRAITHSETGRFTLSGLAPGVYAAVVTTPDQRTLALHFDISGGRTTDVGNLIASRVQQPARTYVGMYRNAGTTRTIPRERIGGASDVRYHVTVESE